MKYTAVARDLARKAGADVAAAILRTLALAENSEQREAVVVMAVGSAMGCLAGTLSETRGINNDDAMKLAAELMMQLSDPVQRAALLQTST